MPITISELRMSGVSQLKAVAEKMDLATTGSKQELIQNILKAYVAKGEKLAATGVMETMQDGSYGFLRSPASSYLAGSDDVYVSAAQIKRFRLRTGDSLTSCIRFPDKGERYFVMVEPTEINGQNPAKIANTPRFSELTAEFPRDWLNMEVGNGTTEDITSRVIDMIAPIGKGQRSLIVAPPKTGKTMMLQTIAHAITANHPECELIVLMIDESGAGGV